MQPHDILKDIHTPPETGYCFIYTLRDPRQLDRVRYVGITARPLSRRLSGHVAQARAGLQRPVQRWIRKLLAADARPEIRLIEQTQDRTRERYWIAHYLSFSNSLLNLAEPDGEDIRCAASTRAKISAFHTGRKRPPETGRRISEALKGRKGRPVSAEARAKISAAHRGKPQSPEHIKNHAEIMRGMKRSEESRRRMAEAARNRPRGLKRKRRTHCHAGHPFSGDNLRIDNQGNQRCHACQNAKAVAHYWRQKSKLTGEELHGPVQKTHCPAGHAYAPENSYRSPNRGDLQCKTCRRQREAERKSRRHAARLGAEA